MSLISFYSIQETPDLQWNVVQTTGQTNSDSKTIVVESHSDKKAAKIAAQKLSAETGVRFIKTKKKDDLFFFEKQFGSTTINNDSGIKINVNGLARRHKKNNNQI